MEKAIIQFVNRVAGTEIQEVQELSTGVTLASIVGMVYPVHLDQSKVVSPDSWMSKLSNLKVVLKALEEYSDQELGKSVDSSDLDLLKTAKYGDKCQVIKLFQLVLMVLVTCENKEEFINNIMQMHSDSQEQLTAMIKKLMSNPELSVRDQATNQGVLLAKLQEMEHQVTLLRKENIMLHEKNTLLETDMLILQQRNVKLSDDSAQLTLDIMDREREPALEIFDNSGLVESLKNKLISQSVEHEREKIRMNQEIEIMRVKIERVDNLQHRCEIYQQRIQDLDQKTMKLEEDLMLSKEELLRKEDFINRLQENCKLLNQRSTKDELQKISLQIDMEKINVRNAHNHEARKALVEPSLKNSLQEDYIQRQSQEQLSIAHRRIKTLQKQLAKSNLKAQKVSKGQVDRKDLEQAFICELNLKREEIDLLVSALLSVKLQQMNLIQQN